MNLLRYSFKLGPRVFPVLVFVGVALGASISLSAILLGLILSDLGSGGTQVVGLLVGFLVAIGVQMTLSPVSTLMVTHLEGIYLRDFESRLGTAGSNSRLTSTVEDPLFHSAISSARSHEYALFGGLSYLWANALPALATVIGVAIALAHSVGLIGALSLMAAIVIDAWWTARIASREADAWPAISGEASRADYYGSFAMQGADAKEVRIFSMLDPLLASYSTSRAAVDRSARRARSGSFWRSLVGFTARMAAALFVLALALANRDGEATLSRVLLVLPLLGAVTTLNLNGLRSLGTASRALAEFEGTAGLAPQSLAVAPAQWPISRSEKASLPKVIDPSRSAPEIVFEKVSFTYPKADQQVLNEVSFVLKKAEASALVGVNGAGKSTVVKLLGGAYAPSGGIIRVDGEPTSEWSATRWRDWQRRIGVVGQDVPKLPISIRDYVSLGAGSLPSLAESSDSDKRVWQSLDRAGMGAMVRKLPRGLSTPASSLAPGGTDFSGGEWQRLTLAQVLRAIDNGASLALLDEPASALDVEAESRLVGDYLRMFEGCTSLVISHRFSVVRPIPHVMVLTSNGIQEEGTHDDLMRRGDVYAAMFLEQSSAWTEGGLEES